MKNKGIVRYIILFFEGIIVGFGAIMPGISGGTLCVAFGMYRPIIEVLSHPKKSIKQYIGILIPFVLGGVVGFLGLSGLASWLLDKNTYMMVCVFIGFIIGTFPELWKDAGKKGRNSKSYVALIIGFLVMMLVLMLFRIESMVMIRPGISGFVVCGVLDLITLYNFYYCRSSPLIDNNTNYLITLYNFYYCRYKLTLKYITKFNNPI